MRIPTIPPRRNTGWTLLIGAAAVLAVAALSACSTPRTPQGIKPVSGFDVERYLGHWHEIARIEHSFERGLIQTSATYSRNDDGTLRVVNRVTTR